jgi:hypothetical protein
VAKSLIYNPDWKKDNSSEERGSGATVDQLVEDKWFGTIGPYMKERYGMTEDTHTREEIAESYMNQMRQFDFGQSVTTVSELTWLNGGRNEEETSRRRQVANDAYRTFDSMPNVFSEGSADSGERADAVRDYARALVVDPVNVIGLGVGSLAARTGGRQAATQAIRRLATQAARRKVQQKGLTGRAAAETMKRETQIAYRQALRSADYKKAVGRADLKGTLTAGATETGLQAGVVEPVRQVSRIRAGVQEEFDPTQVGFAIASGVAVGGLTMVGRMLRGKNQLAAVSDSINRTMENKVRADRIANKAQDPSKLDESGALEEAAERIEDLKDSWKARVQRGYNIALEEGQTTDQANAGLARLFFIGDEKAGIEGISGILEEAGIKYTPTEDGKPFSEWLAQVVERNDKLKGSVKELFDETVGKFSQGSMSFEDWLDLDSSQVSEAGRLLNRQSQLSKLSQSVGVEFDDLTPKKAGDLILDPIEPNTRKSFGEIVGNAQDNYIRMLVAHPGTTYRNVVGWANATALQAPTDLIRGFLYGGQSGLQLMKGDFQNAGKTFTKARKIVSLQGQKIRNFMDPQGTYDDFLDYIGHRPEVQTELMRYLNGGVRDEEIEKSLMRQLGEKVDPSSKGQKFMDFVQTAYGVKAQDFVSKSQEFMYSLDKEMRLKYGRSYNEVLQDDDMVRKVFMQNGQEAKDFSRMEMKAATEALRNVFSKKFGDTDDPVHAPLKAIAEYIEKARRIPVIGAMVPFGQFFNNSLGFMFDYSGVSFGHKVFSTMMSKGTDRDWTEVMARGAVGLGVMSSAAKYDEESFKEGLAWHQTRGPDGAVSTKLYDFPTSYFKAVGRIVNHFKRDQEVPVELTREFLRTFSIDSITRQLGETMTGGYRVIEEILKNPEDKSLRKALAEMAGGTFEMYSSGYTRFADPVNQVMAAAQGEDYAAPDRKQGAEWLNNGLRYVDQIINTVDRGILDQQPKTNALNSSPPDAAVGKAVGYSEVPAQSAVQLMFNDVGRPQWQTELRVQNPQAASVFNEYVAPILNGYAVQLRDNNKWDSLSLKEKQRTLKQMLRLARDDARDMMRSSLDEGANKAEMVYSVTNQKSSIGSEGYNEVLELYDIEESKLHELSMSQLELILYTMKDWDDRQTDLKDLI